MTTLLKPLNSTLCTYTDMITHILKETRNTSSRQSPNFREQKFYAPQWRIVGCVMYYQTAIDGDILAWYASSFDTHCMWISDKAPLQAPTYADSERYAEWARKRYDAGPQQSAFEVPSPNAKVQDWIEMLEKVRTMYGGDSTIEFSCDRDGSEVVGAMVTHQRTGDYCR